MLLAAGLGTRLRPLTDHTPKALAPVAGVPMLEHVVRRLLAAGADRLVINVHHLGEQIADYAAARGGWGVETLVSDEREASDRPLETGGGVRYAAPLLRRDAPFFLHNTDILTDLPLAAMYAAHMKNGVLATVAVMERETSRYLLFDEAGLLGRTNERTGVELRAREPVGAVRKLAFAGVHVVSPRLLDRISEHGAFPIWDPYLRLVAAGERVLPYRADDSHWFDVGSPAQLERASEWEVSRGKGEG
jgi:NDP-sugar pyrophosphorylase family protein